MVTEAVTPQNSIIINNRMIYEYRLLYFSEESHIGLKHEDDVID